MPSLLDAALSWHAAGCSVVPIRTDGTKSPAVAWTEYQTAPASAEQLHAWFGSEAYDGLGLVCGAVSGNLEMLELEGRAVAEGLLDQLVTLAKDNSLDGILTALSTGYLEQSPSGGLHWLYRVDGPARRNLKLARRPATADELAANPAERVKVLAETRGEAGQVVVAPSAGRTHASGKAWTTLAGGPGSIPMLSVDERDALHALVAMLDAIPADDEHLAKAGGNIIRPDVTPGSGGTRPGDDYNTRASWDDILTPHGWTRTRRLGQGHGWRRPGKTDPGISATTGTSTDGADRLYVFSTSTEFESERPYSKFAAFTLLEHHGDYAAAAKALRGKGYGSAAPEPTSIVDLIPSSDGNLATVHALDTRTPHLAVVEERTLDRSDDGNALALINRFGERIRYCHDRGRWLAWDGTRWAEQPAKGGHVRELAKRVARNLPDTAKDEISHKRYSMSATGVTNMLATAETDDRITVTLADLDAHPWELNTPGGILDLRTGQLQPADPSHLHTRVTACAPDQAADPRRWQEFLADTFGDDTSGRILIAYLQRLVGYSAVGIVGPHVLPFCHGGGGNGKGVFLESLQKVLGDYATTAPSGFLMATMHAKHETEIARLAGARMVLCSEVNEDDRFDEAKVKQLTGGDSLTARYMRQDHFTFAPTHQLWLMGNHQPAVRSGGRSFWRRLRLIPFTREVPEAKVIDDLQGILARDHGPALLAWIAAGAVRYAAAGLEEPDSVKAATEHYAHDQDTVARFLEDACHLGGGEHVKTRVSDVRSAYERWCYEAGENPVSAKSFGQAVARRGIGTGGKGPRGVRMYTGITLLDFENAPHPDDDQLAADPSDRGGW